MRTHDIHCDMDEDCMCGLSSGATGAQAFIEQIAQQMPGVVEVESSPIRLSLYLKRRGFRRTRNKPYSGIFDASVVSPEEVSEECLPPAAKSRPVWIMDFAEIYDERIKGVGIGLLGYRAIVEHVLEAGGIFGPHECVEGETSLEAAYVWRRLSQIYVMRSKFIVGRR